MLEGIDALAALETFGTVSEAAVRMRLTQSAVSKRLKALEIELGFALVEADGRRLRLTDRALDLLARARPLVAELRGLAKPTMGSSRASFSLALADSIASSWGPEIVRRAARGLEGLTLGLHVHRTVLVIESVRLGRYDIGLCTETPALAELVQQPLAEEPMILVHARLGPKLDRKAPLLAIEPSSATWRAIHPLLRAHQPAWLAGEIVPVESFGAIVQMAKAGFGNGLVPLGIAREMRLDRRAYRPLPGVARRISLVTRKSIYQLAAFTALRERLAAAAAAYLARR